jgi:hypothetical protein
MSMTYLVPRVSKSTPGSSSTPGQALKYLWLLYATKESIRHPIRINYSFDIYYAYSILNLEPLSE